MTENPLIMSARSAIRAELRAKRRALSEQEQRSAQARLLNQALIKGNKH